MSTFQRTQRPTCTIPPILARWACSRARRSSRRHLARRQPGAPRLSRPRLSSPSTWTVAATAGSALRGRVRTLEALSAAPIVTSSTTSPWAQREAEDSRKRDNVPETFFAQGALSRVFEVGSNFHFEDGLHAKVPGLCSSVAPRRSSRAPGSWTTRTCSRSRTPAGRTHLSGTPEPQPRMRVTQVSRQTRRPRACWCCWA